MYNTPCKLLGIFTNLRFQTFLPVLLLLGALLQACSPAGLEHRAKQAAQQEKDPQRFQDHQEEGVASWYGPKFHGRTTASGEVYNMYELSAAHKLLPLGSKARVTNLENDKAVTVRINDRGPFVEDRILDLSYAAAKKLDIIGSGTSRVRLQVLDLPSEPSNGSYYIQVGSFLSQENAADRLSQLKEQGYAQARMAKATVSGQRFWRVQAGPYPDISRAQDALQRLSRRHPASFMIAD
ncbi:MAG: septal ring lytic transglycosylase RlpA family protein [Desulfohalobiaceae bacterium]